jgi:hypothetical protein
MRSKAARRSIRSSCNCSSRTDEGDLGNTARTSLARPLGLALIGVALSALFALVAAHAADGPKATVDSAAASGESQGCLGCHTDSKDPHPGADRVSCVNCHGGNGHATTKEQAHPKPRHPEAWPTAANPRSSFTLLNNESLEWIRFENPGDLRTAELACGKCHAEIVRKVRKSPMVNSAQVYSTALYNNGTLPMKDAVVAEQYTIHGQPQAIRTIPPPTPEETRLHGILPLLFPLPRFEIGQPGLIFRPFEHGGGPKSELGNPNRDDVPGQPDETLSNRGFGTQASVDPVIIGAQKVRLNDPVMSFLGTNDSPGDFRQSGCSSCHVIYANDRDPFNSGPYAKYGHLGMSVNPDPTIKKDEPGHPIRHEFTRAIPSSQCITCHVHNGNGFLNTYLGYMWWDEETDGEAFYPKAAKEPTRAEVDKAGRFNPEEAASRGLWHDVKFLETLSEKNPTFKNAQFSDYHGHGWVFQRVYKRDRKGNFLDTDGKVIPFEDPDLWAKTVHLKDIHLEKGMQCVDCHFEQDVHGNGKVYGDRRAAIEIDCTDCHGTVAGASSLVTSGPASTGTDLTGLTTPWGEPRFSRRRGVVTQRSMVEEGKSWEVPQVIDTITPGNPHFNERSRVAKTIQRDGTTWGDGSAAPEQLAHANSKMACFSCHSAWVTSCYGCHLAAKVDTKKPMLHNEGTDSQVYPSYNPQVLRSDSFQLAIDGTVLGHRVAPARSSSVVSVSVQNANREWILNQVPTLSSAGYNGNAFNTHPPHTVRGKETKQCTDCHVSQSGDNNSWLAGVLMLGTNQVNFFGKYIFVAQGQDGFSAVSVTERDEPQAVLGSHLHKIAYPARFAAHEKLGKRLTEAQHHGGQVEQVQMYGEYLLVAGGKDGFRVYDAANVGNKGFSQGIVTAPFATQGLRVGTRDASGFALGSPQPLDPKRVQLPVNEENPVAPLFGYAFISDRQEGLVTIDITTLEDGIPTNNHLERAATFNPEGRLNGASSIALAGNYAYLTSDRGLSVVDVSDPKAPRFVTELTDGLKAPRRVAVQFRYAFVADAEGLKVLDVTFPEKPRALPGAALAIPQAYDVYLARSYAYVAAGTQGLAIVDIEKAEHPRLDQLFTGDGRIADARGVKVGMTNTSTFAYVADGKNGLEVVELVSPETVPGNQGYSPRPSPRLVAEYPLRGAAAISEGYRRDRAVDESGNQIAVFGRRGARPFNLEEMRRLFLRNGALYTVTDDPPGPSQGPAGADRKD